MPLNFIFICYVLFYVRVCVFMYVLHALSLINKQEKYKNFCNFIILNLNVCVHILCVCVSVVYMCRNKIKI